MSADFFLDWREVKKTRKPHRCFGCKNNIPEGSHAWYSVGKAEGEFYANYFCDECNSFTAEHPEYFDEDGIGYGEVADARREWEAAQA